LYMSNPSTDKQKAITFLKGLGFKNTTWTAMSRSAKKLPELLPIEGLSIRKVFDAESFFKWKSLVEESLMANETMNHSVFQNLFHLNSVNYYLAYWKGEAVGCSLLFQSEDEAGLYLIGTQEEHRRKGIGSALTLTMLHDAEKQGAKGFQLQATEKGRPVYEKLGFESKGKIWVFNFASKEVELMKRLEQI